MRLLPMKTFSALCVMAGVCLSPTPAATAAPTATARIVNAANAFLATLDDKQRQTVLFAFDDEQQRQRWSNFPTGFVPRGGIDFKEMSAPQRASALALLSSALSPKGYQKVEQIMQGDEVLKSNEGNGPRPPRGNGGPPPGQG